MQSLKDKVAVVTGAGKGIGKAVALALAEEGVHVGLIARTASDLEEVSGLVAARQVKVATALADVSDLAGVDKAIFELQKQLGPIDILINNAGVGVFGGFLELSPEQFETIIKVNLLGTYYVTRAVLPGMIERKTGDIINVSSTAGLRGSAMTSAYSASKFGVIGLTESLMQEVRKHNIRVTALTPSTVATDLAISLKLTDGNPDKVMQPEDVAELIIAQLKLNPRVFIKDSGIWSTNP